MYMYVHGLHVQIHVHARYTEALFCSGHAPIMLRIVFASLFSAVEEIVDYSLQLYSSVSPATTLAPARDLKTRPPIHSPSPTTTSYPTTRSIQPTARTTRPPLPPPKPQRPPEMNLPASEDIIQDSMYFMLSPSGDSVLQDEPQAAYEEMEYDRVEMNRNPPPIWKPPPQPLRNPSSPSTSSIIYSRIEGGKFVDPPSMCNDSQSGSAHRPHPIKKPEVSKQRKPIKPNFGSREDDKPFPLPKQAPPPIRAKPMRAPRRGQDENPMKHILKDPNLVGKLQEKRQELYGPVDVPRASVSSCDSQNPMENYEEVCFDLVGAANTDSSEAEEESVFSRQSNMTLPPRRHNIGSEVAMMQCPPEEPKAQDYLSFQASPSHSPSESTTDLTNRDSHASRQSLSPHLQRKTYETKPELPPRGADRMREGSPRLVRKPISPAAHHHMSPTVPLPSHTVPHQPLQKDKSSSQENLRDISAKRRPLPPRPASSALQSPPPVPFRNTSINDETLPQPRSRQDRSVPLPLPSAETPPQPPVRQNRQPPSMRQTSSAPSSPPPPVPVRQPNASGVSLSTGQMPLTRLSSHDDDDDAPPVPSRGARQRDIHTNSSNSSLLRPHSTQEVASKPKVTPRPANRLKPLPAPKPSVTPKPTALTKPPTSNKPATSTKPHKLPHVAGTSPGHQNGQLPPPLPPR